MCIFSLFFIHIFHHLKLKIALAIPASNDEKIEANNSPAKNNSVIVDKKLMK